MQKRILLSLAVAALILSLSKLSFAMICGDHSGSQQMAQAHTEPEQGITEGSKQTVTEEVVNVGNKICPVSGEKIDDKMKTTYEYEGKIYNFCCASCVDDFKKDPQKYIKKVEQELQGKLQDELESEEETTHEVHQH